MLRKIRRQMSNAVKGNNKNGSAISSLKLEPLENRLLLDVAGYWSELGYRSGSGGGVSWDPGNEVGETSLVTTSDGDSVAFWVEGQYGNSGTLDVSDYPVQGTYAFNGTVHCKQYAGEDLGWWDFSYGSGDQALAYGGQIDAASGPDGTIIISGVGISVERFLSDDSPFLATYTHDQLLAMSTQQRVDLVSTYDQAFVMLWDGQDWQDITIANLNQSYESTVNPNIIQTITTDIIDDNGDPIVDEGEAVTQTIIADVTGPAVAVNDAGEIFVTYSVEHPNTDQSEVVVMKYGYTYADQNIIGAPLANDKGWEELTTTEVGLLGETSNQLTAGVSNSGGNSYDPSIAIDQFGKPVVVWTEAFKSRNAEIYGKVWDGDSWNEIGLNSASYSSTTDNSGISSNSFQDIQPDVAITDDGDIIVSWVCWHNWASYQTDGDAAIYARYLPASDLDGNWRGYSFEADGDPVESDDDAGIAQGNNVPEGRAGLGWYYNPSITLDAAQNPVISWFGWGEGENKAVNRNETPAVYDDPYWGTFVSYYYDHDSSAATNNTFEILFEDYDEAAYEWLDSSISTAQSNVQRAVANEPDKLAWAPSILYSEEDGKILLSYVQASDAFLEHDHDQEVFVKYWDTVTSSWVSYGMGAATNGNEVFSDYPTLGEIDGDIAYFEFNSDSTDDYDVVVAVPDSTGVNEGKLYVYDRYSGTWSENEPASAGGQSMNTIDTDGDTITGFGVVYDLDGEPEIEYDDIDGGNPVVAFLGDDDGLPYVYEYTISSGWQPVGTATGQIGDIVGNLGVADYQGIDIQVGAGGSMLVAYVATDENDPLVIGDEFNYVVTRLYNPTTDTWGDAELGALANDAIAEVTYFANFDGYDFDEIGDLSDGDYDGDGNRVYEDNNTWYYWDGNADTDIEEVSGDITGYSDEDLDLAWNTDRLDIWYNNDGDPMQGALEFSFEMDDEFTGNAVSATIDHQFDMINDGDIIVSFDASLDGQGSISSAALADPMVNMDLYLYLTINGAIVDVNANDSQYDNTYFPQGGEVTPIAVCKAGELMEMTTFQFDSTNLQYRDLSSVDLSVGDNRLGFIAVAANDGTGAAGVAQSGAIRIDNVVVYQRIISENRFVGDQTYTFDNTDAATLLGDGWDFNNGDIDVEHTIEVGESGDTDDDAITMTFDSSANRDSIAVSPDYTMSETGLVRIDFDYRLVTDEDFGEDDVLEFTIATTGNGIIETIPLTGPAGDTEWTRVSLVTTAAEAGDINVTFTGTVLNNDASTDGRAYVYIDNVDISNTLTLDLGADVDLTDADSTDGSDWVYVDNSGSVAVAFDNNAGDDGAGDGAIVMTYTGGISEISYDDLAYAFTTGTSSGAYFAYLDLDFSYRISLDNTDMTLGEYGQLQAYLVEDLNANGILDESEIYYDELTGVGSLRQYADGVTDNDSGWVDVTNLTSATPLDPSTTYFVIFRGVISDSTAGGGNSTTIAIDDVDVNYSGYSTWATNEIGFNDFRYNNGSNNTVGMVDNAGNYEYNFHGDMRTALIDNTDLGIRSQMLTIPDYNQAYTGDATIALRYRWTDLGITTNNYPNLNDIKILIDGVEYDANVLDAQFGAPAYASSSSWSNGNTFDPKYSWFNITIPDLEVGDHDISVELQGGTNCWIDNLVIQTTRAITHTINPIVKLGAVGQDGNRAFIVGATYMSQDMLVYVDGDVGAGKHLISSLSYNGRNMLEAAYYHAALFELNDNVWEKYGTSHAATATVEFVGVRNSGTTVPVSTLYYLDDFTVGPNQVEWALLTRSTTDPVDPNEDGKIDYYVIHPFDTNNPPEYWHEHTITDLVLRRWDITDDDDTDNQQWVDVEMPLPETNIFGGTEYRSHMDGQLISGPNQAPTVAWTNYSNWHARSAAQAYRYVDGTWQALGAGSNIVDGDVQNNDYWSAMSITEMIPDQDGDPLIVYEAGHMFTYCVREFVPNLEDSDAVIAVVGSDDPYLMDFGLVGSGVISRQFSLTNTGLGDLYIQDITIGGLDAIINGFEITNDPGVGTDSAIIEAGNNNKFTFNLLFDPSRVVDIEPGTYEGVIVIQTNEGESEYHPFDNFQEINVKVVVENFGDIVVDNDYFYFDDATVAGSAYDPDDPDDDQGNTVADDDYLWETKTVYVSNDGTAPMNVNSLVYTGAGFAIKSVKKNGSDTDLDVNDDGVLDAPIAMQVGDYLAVEVAFIPKEAILYDETMFVCTDDTLDPVIPIRLLGYGLSGGDMEVDISIDGVSWTKVWRSNVTDSDDVDEVLNLGSTVWGQSDETPLRVRVTNTGTTNLNIEDIHFQSGTAQIAFGPDSVIEDVDIAPGDSMYFDLTYTPDTSNVEDVTSDILYVTESLFILTDAQNDSEVVLSVDAYAVPQAPVIQVIDADTGIVVSGWDPEQGWITGFINLGSGNVGSSVFTRTLNIRNIGGANLDVEGITIGYTGDGTEDNYIINPANTIDDGIDIPLVNNGDDYTIVITFTPESTGEKDPLFIVDYKWVNNDSVTKYDQTFTEFYALVTDQTISVGDNDGLSNSKLNFANVGIGSTLTKDIEITNTGATNLNIQGWTLMVYDADLGQYVAVVDDTAGDDWVSNSAVPYSVLAFDESFYINGLATQDIPVVFAPTVADMGSLSQAILRIYSNDSTQTAVADVNDPNYGNYYFDYEISGQAVSAGDISLDIEDSIANDYFDFGSVFYGQPWKDADGELRKVITVTNSSDALLSIENIYTTNGVFKVWTDIIDDGSQIFQAGNEYDMALELAPGDSILVAVSFYAAHSEFDTSLLDLGDEMKLIVEYDNYSDEALQSKEIILDANVVMSQQTTDRVRRLTWTDDNNHDVTIIIAGPGDITVNAVDSNNNDIGSIIVTGSTSRTVLKIIGQRGLANNSVVGSIVGEDGEAISELGSILMRYVDLDGSTYDAGYEYDVNIASLAGRLILGDITGETDIEVSSSPARAVSVSTGSIASGSDIHIGANVRAFVVNSITSNDRGLQADSIQIDGILSGMVVRDYGDITTDITVDDRIGVLNFGRVTDFTGDITADGSIGIVSFSTGGKFTGDLIAENLTKMIAGNLEDAKIAVEDNIRYIYVRENVIDSLILSGVTPGSDGLIGTSDDGLVGGSVINKVIVGDEFKDSSMLAGVGVNSDPNIANRNYSVFGEYAPASSVSGTIGYVRFGSINLGEGTSDEFGVAAGTSIRRFISDRTLYTPTHSWQLDTVIGDDFFLRTF